MPKSNPSSGDLTPLQPTPVVGAGAPMPGQCRAAVIGRDVRSVWCLVRWPRRCRFSQPFEEGFLCCHAQRERILDPDYFCQEFIPGSTEFATHILFVDGRIVKALNIKYELTGEAPIKGQDAERLRIIRRCKYLDLFALVLRTVQYQGLCCVNYKVAKGQPFLLEINPRFGGSLAPYFFSFLNHLH